MQRSQLVFVLCVILIIRLLSLHVVRGLPSLKGSTVDAGELKPSGSKTTTTVPTDFDFFDNTIPTMSSLEMMSFLRNNKYFWHSMNRQIDEMNYHDLLGFSTTAMPTDRHEDSEESTGQGDGQLKERSGDTTQAGKPVTRLDNEDVIIVFESLSTNLK
eukprot:TRINITY_DN157515_c0_g1_i1.p1 TRINITY_DN157515_c0_g1~~TRINITY_DN157515_c0_g1_i1.p1  ORF type:complete len:158 (+),score=8.63 TRINITY_DN157515_c0_g1_i1:81-554(+)